jgi:hypothetical protein
MARHVAHAAVAIVLGAAALVGGCANLPEGEGDCGVEHRYEGARYVGPPTGALRQPRGAQVVGQAERTACAKVIGHDDVFEVAGVSPEVAVVIDGYLLVRRGATPPARLLRAASRPVLCSRPTVLRGTWQGSLQTTRHEGPEINRDGSSRRPYRLEIDATGGDHAAFGRWQRLRLTVVVTTATEFAPEDELKASYDLVPMLIASHCDGDRFVADRIALDPSGPDPS